ncbi:MAG: HD domain-containing protein, partial [Candidatus Aminicenantes bacterium]
KELFERFCACPGSQSYHHAYLGGLLEHTVAVADNCAHVAGRYQGVDRDLLVASALLHDVGKVDELTFETGVGYTDEGRLIGHVVLGARRAREAAARAGTDATVLLRLEHAMLSHHGELECGSPKKPSTIEALLLHHVDNMDAKSAGFAQVLSGATLAEEVWTDSANLFRRPLFAPRALEDDRPHRADEDAQHFRLTA